MRKRLIAWIGIGLFWLTGCSRKAAPPAAIDFLCDAHILYKDIEIGANLTRTKAGVLKMDIYDPPSLEDMVITLDSGRIEVEMYGMSFNLNPDNLPVSGLAKGVLDVLDTVAKSDEPPRLTENGAVLVGKSQNGDFTLISDPDTGELVSLSVPDIPLEITFSSFQKAE